MAGDFLRILLPRVPDMLSNSLWHTLGATPESKKWDLKATLAITTIRGIMANSTSTITQQQAFGSRDPGIKANQAIVDTTLPAPKDGDEDGGVRQVLCRAIDELKETGDEEYDIPPVEPVEGEWQAWTEEKDIKKLAQLSVEERYSKMISERTSPVTILYFHGGAYYLMDPKSHRGTCAKLSQLTGGRAFSVRYRLAPQNPFPAAILDAFIAYLSLLYPPSGALHDPVKPEHIVFAGDSAGGNLSLVFMLFLLHLHHTNQTKVHFHGREVDVPLPAGVTTNSAWTDVTRCMPSLQTNAHYDYLPPVTTTRTASTEDRTINNRGTGPAPKDPAGPPPCSAWPSPPPRADLYCSGTMLCHPLVSPLAATVQQWRGVPNVFMCVGEEMLSDEGNVVTQRIVAAQTSDNAERTKSGKQTVGTVCEAFEAMPHCFAMLLQGSKVSERCFKGWAEAIGEVVGTGTVETRATWIDAPKLEEETRDITRLADYREEDIRKWMSDEREARQRRWRERYEVETNDT